MDPCGKSSNGVTKIDDDILETGRRHQAIKDRIIGKGEVPELVRWAIGMTFNGKPPSDAQLNSIIDWFMVSEVSRNPGNQLFSNAEYARIEGRLKELESTAEKAMKDGRKIIDQARGIQNVDVSKLPGMKKFWHLAMPVTGRFWVATKMYNGQRLWDNVTRQQSNHVAKMNRASQVIGELNTAIKDLGGDTYRNDMREARRIDNELQRINALRQARAVAKKEKKAEWEEDGQDKQLKEKEDALWEQRSLLYAQREGQDERTSNIGAGLNRDIVRLIEKKAISDDAYRGELGTVAKKHRVSAVKVNSLVEKIEAANKVYRDIGQDTVKTIRDVVVREVRRAGGDEQDVADVTRMITDMGIVQDGYFTRKAVVEMNPVSLVKTLKDMVDDVKLANNSTDALNIIRQAIGSQSSFTRSRGQGEMPEDIRNFDITTVMRTYMQSMLHSNHVAKFHLIVSDYLSGIHEVAMNNNSMELVAYTRAMEKYAQHIRSKLIGTQSHGAGHNSSSAILAFATGALLGGVRIAGSVKNAVEAQAQISTKLGGYRYAQLMGQLMTNKGQVKSFLETLKRDYNIKLSSSVLFDGTADDAGVTGVGILGLLKDRQLARLYASEERQQAALVEGRFSSKANEAVQKGAEIALLPWTAVENMLRNQAFDLAAIQALNYVDREIAPLFEEGLHIPEAIIKHYGLDKAKLNGTKNERDSQLIKVKEIEALEKGLTFVRRTQMEYDALARHSIEDVKLGGFQLGKLSTLFRQYSLGQNTELALNAVRMYHEMKASPDWFKPTPDEKAAGFVVNPRAAYISVMIGLMGLGVFLEREKGILGGRAMGYFRNDATEVGKFIAKATSKDPNDRKWNNYGGAFWQIFTGPPLREMMWAANVAALQMFHERGDLPSDSQMAVQYITGINRDPKMIGFEEDEDYTDVSDNLNMMARHFRNGFSTWRDLNEYDLAGDTKTWSDRTETFVKHAFGAREAYKKDDPSSEDKKKKERREGEGDPRNP